MKNLVQHITEKLQISRRKKPIPDITFDELHSLILKYGDSDRTSSNTNYIDFYKFDKLPVIKTNGKDYEIAGIFSIIMNGEKAIFINVHNAKDIISRRKTYFYKDEFNIFLELLGPELLDKILTHINNKRN